MRRSAGFMLKFMPLSAGELVASVPTAYMKRVRRPDHCDRNSGAATEKSRPRLPDSRFKRRRPSCPNIRRKSVE